MPGATRRSQPGRETAAGSEIRRREVNTFAREGIQGSLVDARAVTGFGRVCVPVRRRGRIATFPAGVGPLRHREERGSRWDEARMQPGRLQVYLSAGSAAQSGLSGPKG